jgi:hypothetical protein
MNLDLMLFSSNNDQDTDRLEFKSILQDLRSSFPYLPRLRIAFSENLYWRSVAPSKFMSEVDEILLNPLGELAHDMGISELTVEVTSSVYAALVDRAIEGKASSTLLDSGRRGFFHTVAISRSSSGLLDAGNTERIRFWVQSGARGIVEFTPKGNYIHIGAMI